LRELLALPQTWGVIVAKTFTDPVWFFVADWFPLPGCQALTCAAACSRVGPVYRADWYFMVEECPAT